MYHHHSQQQGPQSFSNGSRPPHHQQPSNQQQSHPATDIMTQVGGFQFPRPTQLPDELESALAIRGSRDIDHRVMDSMNRQNQHQSQGPGSDMGQHLSEHGSYNSNPLTLTPDSQSGHQQGADWSKYQPPTKSFGGHPSSVSHQSQQHQGPQQATQSSHAGTCMSSWTTPITDSPLSQVRNSHGGRSSGGADGQGLYTSESAGSILASFGLSNEDLEVLSHYPDDQLTPDTLPFILREIQVSKSNKQSKDASLAHSGSPEVPSLLTVTKTAGEVIDYGHASRAKEESGSRETFKREPLSSERTVKMVYSSSTVPKLETAERQVCLEPSKSNKHGDRDYRRTSADIHKSSRSPRREFPPLSKSRPLDHDYRRERPKMRPSSETRSETSPFSRHTLSSSSGLKPQSSSKRFPTPTLINDFNAIAPKVYPHTCSLCHIECDQEKDWIGHVNTVSHTAACRDLRNKYPDWKPHLPRKSGRYDSHVLWDPKEDPIPSYRPRSWSQTPSPPRGKHRVSPHAPRLYRRPYFRHYHQGDPSRSSLRRSHYGSRSPDRFTESSHHRSTSKADQSSTKTVSKSGQKTGSKAVKTTSGKDADASSPAKKKKKMMTTTLQSTPTADCLVYLTGIPLDASEQEVTDLVASFGKINNVILMPGSEEESEKGEGQKASVCMVKAEDAIALAHSTKLCIRDKQITALVAKNTEADQSSPDSSNPASTQDKSATGEESGSEDYNKITDETKVLITGLPDSGWTENDIVELVQPFVTVLGVVQAPEIGKVLLSVEDLESAQEMVKVHTFSPAKIKDTELKMFHLKQNVGMKTPVALYNLLMGSVDPLEISDPVGWSCLLVISNVPDTPNGPSEVQKLVRRFGTVIKTLVLPKRMVICEMATAAMALSVYKRFQRFPCMIQNNPLCFSRKPDPKSSVPSKVISSYLDSSKDTSANEKDSQLPPAADEEEAMDKETCDSATEGKEEDGDDQDGNKVQGNEMESENEGVEINESNDEGNEINKMESAEVASTEEEAKLEEDVEMEEMEESETAHVEMVTQTTEEKQTSSESQTGNDEAPAEEDTEPATCDEAAASTESTSPELPKLTQQMVNVLLEEYRSRTANHSNKPRESEEKGEEQNEKPSKDVGGQPKEVAKDHKEEEEVKRRERKERVMRRDKEPRDRERREKERKIWEEDRARRMRDRDDRSRREWERTDRDRRDRKRTHSDVWSGSRSSSRSDSNKQSSGKEAAEKTKKAGEEEEFDDFLFNLGDFVTVDEVGEVTDFPRSPSPSVPVDAACEGEDSEAPIQQDTVENPISETAGEKDSGTTLDPMDSEQGLESEIAPDADSLVTTDMTPAASPPQPVPSSSLTNAAAGPEESEMETTLETGMTPLDTLDPVPELECSSSTSAPAAFSDTDEAAAAAAAAHLSTETCPSGSETVDCEDKEAALNHSQAPEQEMVDVTSDKAEDQDEGKSKLEAPAGAGKRETDEEVTNTEVECVTEKSKTQPAMSTDCPLPPFDPNNPVGMEFLVPKTGFFCKVCGRFFSGTKEAEVSHCRTLKHYESLQKYLHGKKTVKESEKSTAS